MSTIETTTTSLQPPEPDYVTDEAQLAAAAFLARYSARTLDAYRHDHRLGTTDAVAAPLVPLRAAILAADKPTQVRTWLRDSSAGQLLGRLVSGETTLSHAALDAHAADRRVMHLRALLIAVEVLPGEDRSINRFERFAAGLLDGVADTGDRQVVRAWLHWQVLPRLRARDEAGLSMAHRANNARRSLRHVTAFLDHLAARGLTLRGCTPADLDG
jgi:hypothetical protein